MTTVYKFKAYYKTDGVGAVQDPAPVCTVINMADDSKLADAQATTASTNMPGLYTYSYSGADGLDCVAFFHTTDADADEADIGSYVTDKITTLSIIEGTYTLKDAIRLIMAKTMGKVSGGGTSEITFRSTGDDVDRIVATVDANGNRTVVVLDPDDAEA
jgi:hypothetical protein